MENDELNFPLCVFPKEIREIIEQTSAESYFPIPYISASLLFAASIALGNTKTLKVSPSWIERPLLFMAILGSPGSAKTPPIKFALDPFLKIDADTLKRYKQALSEWKALPLDRKGAKPIPKQLRVQDITMEAITKILDASPRGIFVYVDELKGWISSFNKYRNGGGDLEQWLSIWSGIPITVNRKSDDEIHFVNSPFVGVIGGLQPGLLPKLFSGEKMDDGFFYRLLFVPNPADNEPILWRDPDLPSGVEDRWKKILEKMLASSGYFDEQEVNMEYSFSQEAWTAIKSWQNTREEENVVESESCKAIFRKIQTYALRFSLIIHSMREATGEIPESTEIDFHTAIMATILADYFDKTAQFAYELAIKGCVKNEKFFELLGALDTDFTTAQAEFVGKQMGLARATVFRYLKDEANNPFIRQVSRGHYRKLS